MNDRRFILGRRSFLQGLAGATLLTGCSRGVGQQPGDARINPGSGPVAAAANPGPNSAVLPSLQACDKSARVCAATADNIEGPFFKAGAPRRTALAGAETTGVPLELSGLVVDADCRPLAGARMEIWHADSHGAYDNRGFGFRAHMLTDAKGRYQLRTIVPGHYLNGRRYRPAHIHVKLVAPDLRPLTTQLYFAGDPWNHGDAFIEESLIMKPRRRGRSLVAGFDFALARA